MNVSRNLIIGTIVAVLVTALLIVVYLGEPARMKAKTDAQAGESIARGALWYDAYCGGCHGQRGEGLTGIYPPLNVEDMWTGREEIAFYGTLEDYIQLNISAGHPAQRMPSWSQEYGGPLRDDQIQDLTNFVMNWQGPQPPGVRSAFWGPEPTAPAQETPGVIEATPEAAGEGDPVQGEELFVRNCSSCHGPGAEGGALGPTLLTAEQAAQDDDFFRETINNGRAGTSMPAWGALLSAQDVEDIIAFLRSKQ
jgi:mono/diheme cytochrome c family protein